MRRPSGVGLLATAALLLLAGCRRPAPRFREKVEALPPSIDRAVLFAYIPGSKEQGFFETRDPKLIARLIEGLRSASRPRNPNPLGAEEAAAEGISSLYLVPPTGKPILFGLMLERVEHHFGRGLADPIGELLKEKPTPLFEAYDKGRKDLTGLRKAVR